MKTKHIPIVLSALALIISSLACWRTNRPSLAIIPADLDLKAIFKAMREFGCAGRILCESPIMEEDALNMKKAWMKVSGEKEK